jgi:HEAT repeat protein
MSPATGIIVTALLALGAAARTGDGALRYDDPKPKVDTILATWRSKGGENPDALVALGSNAAPYLCQLLDSRVEGLPVEPIALAIGRLGASHSIPTLGRLLDSGSAKERAVAVEALRISGQRDRLSHLARAFEDPDDAVSSHAETALLAATGESFVVVSIVQQRILRAKDKARLCRLLGRIQGPEAGEALLEMLTSINDDDVLAALQGLWLRANVDDGDHVTELALRSDSVPVRKETCIVLGKLKYKRGTRALIELLRDANEGVVANAHWALREITGEVLKPDFTLWDQWWQRAGKLR